MTTEHKPHCSPDAAINLAYRLEQKIAPQERDDGWADPDTGEWVSMPGTVRALIRPEDTEQAIAAIRSLVEQYEDLEQRRLADRDLIDALRNERNVTQKALDGTLEQLEATQKALREFHEEMWTVQNGDDPPFVSNEGLKYMESWFDRTRHLLGEDREAFSVSIPKHEQKKLDKYRARAEALEAEVVALEGDAQSPATESAVANGADTSGPSGEPGADSVSSLDSSIDIEGAESGWRGAPDPASEPEAS